MVHVYGGLPLLRSKTPQMGLVVSECDLAIVMRRVLPAQKTPTLAPLSLTAAVCHSGWTAPGLYHCSHPSDESNLPPSDCEL